MRFILVVLNKVNLEIWKCDDLVIVFSHIEIFTLNSKLL